MLIPSPSLAFTRLSLDHPLVYNPCASNFNLAINPAMSEVEIRRRWDKGQEYLLSWIEGTMVYHGWHARRPVYLPYLGRTLRLLEGDYLISDTFTHAAFRRRRDHRAARSILFSTVGSGPSAQLACDYLPLFGGLRETANCQLSDTWRESLATSPSLWVGVCGSVRCYCPTWHRYCSTEIYPTLSHERMVAIYVGLSIYT